MNDGVVLDPFTAEIIRNYLLSTVREMYQTTIRTAYSTCFSEGEDFTCALFDVEGRMIAQAYGIPGHSGALSDPVRTILSRYDEFNEGDVFLFNDPFDGGSHQADVVVCRPTFFDGRLLGFAVNQGHWVDVGGMAPGGWSGTATHVVQEALIIPPVRLYFRGKLNSDVREFILRNVRLPKQCWGDLEAQIASNVVAEQRLRALAETYGEASLLKGMELALDYSKRRFLQKLTELPDGEYQGEEVLEDDGHGGGPYHIRVTMLKSPEGVTVDYAGTDSQVRGPINLSFTFTKAAAYSSVIAVVDPDVPLNTGVMELIDVRAPTGSLLNPEYPAPVFCCADPINKASEAVLKAASQMAPDRVSAGTYCTGNNVTGSGHDPETREEFLWYIFESGGCGARKAKDGNSVEWHLIANCKNESMEIWETRYPVLFEGYGMVTDSAGPGRFRGGLGAKRSLRFLADTDVTGCADRHQVPPWGLFGGRPGLPNRFSVTRNGEEHRLQDLFALKSPSKFYAVPLQTGDIFHVMQGGGGGYGDPLDRDVELVAADVRDGYVSIGAAQEAYGVMIDPASGEVDVKASGALRHTLRVEGSKA
jgi:N-methylhydantoinase B/oxoprolinase/acetone carboxylase alpha subunit